MKKFMVFGASLCLALAFSSCGSKESAYRRAYEKARSQEAAQTVAQQPVVTETPVVTPVETRPATQAQVTDNSDGVTVRQERVSVINGSGLRNFSVVVGSFSVIANAEGLQQRLKNAGYGAQIVKNEERNMYRVVATTFDNKADAVASRDQLRATYPDAWLLFNQR